MTTRTAVHDQAMPRGLLLGIGGVLALTLLAAGWVRLSGTPIRAPDAPAVTQKALRFEDRPDGGIAVIDAATGREFDTVSGQAGFVRGTLRGLARERKRMGLGPQQPFMLIGRADGRLSLHDPATGRIVDLESFGPVNAGVFARLLEPAPPGGNPATPTDRSTP